MSNRFGQAYGLTVLSPITGGVDEHGLSRDVALRRELRELNAAPESPFADVPTTHLARWVVIDDAPFEGVPAKVDHFASKYLLFTSNFDTNGQADDAAFGVYMESLRTAIPQVLERLYQHCLGFPGVENPEAFRIYMKACQVPTTFFFGAYQDATVEQVLRALDAQRRMSAFVLEQQHSRPTPERLKQAFGSFLSDIKQAPTPRPGTI
jgi:hypothetical protein